MLVDPSVYVNSKYVIVVRKVVQGKGTGWNKSNDGKLAEVENLDELYN